MFNMWYWKVRVWGRVWSRVCGFYYRQKLKWQFKGKKEAFENYLRFQDAKWYCKFQWEDPDTNVLIAQDIEFRANTYLSAQQAMNEFRSREPIPLMNTKDKKTVRQTIKDSILELKNQKELGLPE